MTAVFITGHSRSGTSMTAGLLAAHGVWFGPCHGPAAINKKGFYESDLLKDCIRKKAFYKFHDRWQKWMRKHNAGVTWGVKTGPEYYRLFSQFKPLVICTRRPAADILDSRRRAGFAGGMNALRRTQEHIDKLPATTFMVWPDQFVNGDFSSLEPILGELGFSLNPQAALDWIAPELWNNYGG